MLKKENAKLNHKIEKLIAENSILEQIENESLNISLVEQSVNAGEANQMREKEMSKVKGIMNLALTNSKIQYLFISYFYTSFHFDFFQFVLSYI